MKKSAIYVTVGIITIITLIILTKNNKSSDVIREIVVYESGMSIGKLYQGNPSFDEIDRTNPEGVLFCKTKTKTTSQVKQLYTSSANDSDMMGMIENRSVSSEFREEISQKKLLFSFYYIGVYGPPHWFCIFESRDGNARAVFFLEQEKGIWRQGTDVAKYPVRVAFFDLAKKHGVFNSNRDFSLSDIDSFLDDFRIIDNTISIGLAEDPEHYGPMQILE